MSKTKLKELDQRLDDIFQKQITDPNYRKSHCLELSEN